jgi:hypothetical protein
MPSALALAAVTALLKHRLDNGLAEADVTSELGGDAIVSALPPDRIALGPDERAQLNLFLYLVTPHPGLRNNGPTNGVRPLAVDLHYLLTAYGAQDYHTEILLGHALQLLHATPVIERDTIRTTLAGLSRTRDRRVVPPALAALAASDLPDRVERIKIDPEFLGSEEVSKLWSALQARYRPSATYKVSAVFLDTNGPPS